MQIDRDQEVILVRWQDAVYAFNLSCPHQRTTLRWNQGDSQFQCPKHHSKYRPDGTFVSGRATRGMDRFSVSRSDDEIVVDLNAMHKEDQDPTGWHLPWCAYELRRLPDGGPADLSGAERARRSGGIPGRCAVGGGGITGPSFTGPLGDYPSLDAVGGIARVDADNGYPIAVVRMAEQQYAAFSLVCPHQGATVNISGSGFLCPGNGARFAADGHWVGGQPTSNLRSLSAAYDAGSGTLTIS